jgi:hypothetical protein
MPSATRAAKGAYRPEFLSAIDACLKVRHSERPRSVAQLRPMLLVGGRPQPVREREPSKPTKPVSTPLSQPRKASALAAQPSRPVRRWPAAAAALLAIVGGAYGGYEFMRWQPSGTGTINVAVKRQTPDADSSAQAAADAVRREADIDAERHRQEDARAETQRQADLDAAERRRKEEAETAARRQAEIDAERRRQELAEAQRQADEREAERHRQEEIDRVAAADARRTAEEEEARRKASEPAKVASAVLSADERATFVRQVQEVLKKGRCYEGAVNGRGSADTQEALDDFVAASGKKTKTKPVRIELAKATGADFETWLRDAGTVSGDVCSPPPPAAKPKVAKPAREREEPQQRRRAERQERPRQAAEPREREQPKKFCWGYKNELKEC